MAAPPESTRASLLDELYVGGESGYKRLVALYGPWLYARCRTRGLSAHDAEDVVQEVFRTVFEKFEQFERKGFRGWLVKIQLNKVADHFRRTKKQQPRGGSEHHRRLENHPAPQTLHNSAAVNADSTDDLSTSGPAHRALRLLEDSGRFEVASIMAFRLTELEGWTSAEVAAKYNLTETAVRNAKVRVRRALRKLLLDGDAEP